MTHPRDAYQAVVKTWLPSATGRRLATRCQMMLLRDWAFARRIGNAHNVTHVEKWVLTSIEKHAHFAALAPMTDEQLTFYSKRLAGFRKFAEGFDCENVREFWDAMETEDRVMAAICKGFDGLGIHSV